MNIYDTVTQLVHYTVCSMLNSYTHDLDHFHVGAEVPGLPLRRGWQGERGIKKPTLKTNYSC